MEVDGVMMVGVANGVSIFIPMEEVLFTINDDIPTIGAIVGTVGVGKEVKDAFDDKDGRLLIGVMATVSPDVVLLRFKLSFIFNPEVAVAAVDDDEEEVWVRECAPCISSS